LAHRIAAADGTTTYPEAVRRPPRRRAAFFDSYLTNLIERDVKELTAIERRGDLRRLLALLAGRSGGLLVPATPAAEWGSASRPARALRDARTEHVYRWSCQDVNGVGA
jgi:predicted AAA+ superfamily ATPase